MLREPLTEDSPLWVLLAAVRRAGLEYAMRYNRYTDMTVLVGAGLWWSLLDHAKRVSWPPTPVTTADSGTGTDLVLNAPGQRSAVVVASRQLGDRAWKLTFDSGMGGEIP